MWRAEIDMRDGMHLARVRHPDGAVVEMLAAHATSAQRDAEELCRKLKSRNPYILASSVRGYLSQARLYAEDDRVPQWVADGARNAAEALMAQLYEIIWRETASPVQPAHCIVEGARI